MVFSSSVFLFAFLPLSMAVYFILRSRRARNVWLLLVSLAFYAWGEPVYVLLMIVSIIANWALARAMGDASDKPQLGEVLEAGGKGAGANTTAAVALDDGSVVAGGENVGAGSAAANAHADNAVATSKKGAGAIAAGTAGQECATPPPWA